MSPRTPMTPERFQSRDVKRRLTKQENRLDYLKADFARMMARVRDLEEILALLEKGKFR